MASFWKAVLEHLLQDFSFGFNLLPVLQLLPMAPAAFHEVGAHRDRAARTGFQNPDYFRPREFLFFFHRPD